LAKAASPKPRHISYYLGLYSPLPRLLLCTKCKIAQQAILRWALFFKVRTLFKRLQSVSERVELLVSYGLYRLT